MRYMTAMLLAFVIAVPSAQTPSIWVSINEGSSRAGLAAMEEPYTIGGPWAAIPARALKPDAAPTAHMFRIRSWREGAAARIVVLAVVRDDASAREQETQIATFVLTPGESVEVTQTERYAAARVTVSASDTPPAAAADRERRYLNVRVSLF